jgi:CHRD domain
MWTRDKWMLAIAVLFSTAIPACDDDDDDDGGTEPETEFEATLSGSEEVPAVSTPASGSATVSIQGSAIVYRVDVANIENVVVSHIHVAPPGENGDVRMNLCNTDDTPDCSTTGTGVLVEGSNGIAQGITFDSLVSAIRAGNAYVNVHTSDGVEPANTGPGDFPGGEIRGQLTPQ